MSDVVGRYQTLVSEKEDKKEKKKSAIGTVKTELI